LSLLPEIVRERDPDVLILAEAPDSDVAIVEKVNHRSRRRYHLPVNLSDRLRFFVTAPPQHFEPVYDGPGIAIRRMRTVLAEELTIVAVHLSSKLHLVEDDQTMLAARVARRINEFERKIGHMRTVVIGDFNMNPFETGLVGADTFHAVMSLSVANRGARIVQGEECPFFYNPMWSLLGDQSPGPPGTYYYAPSGLVSYFWNTFDQIILRPQLAARFERGDVTVVDEIASLPLLTTGGIPDRKHSDHLPLEAVIRLGEVQSDAEELVG
jgi:hypothetical protein